MNILLRRGPKKMWMINGVSPWKKKKKKKTLFYGYGRPPWRWPYRTALSGKSPPAVCALTLTFWLEFVPTFRVYYSDDRSMPVNINQGSRKNCEERERQWGIIRIFKSIHHIEWLSARSKSNTRNSYMRNVDNRWKETCFYSLKKTKWLVNLINTPRAWQKGNLFYF